MATVREQLIRFQQVIAAPEPPHLGPQSRAGTAGEQELAGRLAQFYARQRISSRLQPLLNSAALWWHDHLDASHTVSQGIETPEGSWLHGIMHRREPDYGNAKYWFHRVGRHEGFAGVAEGAAALLSQDGQRAARLLKDGEWQPIAFIDECERAEQGNDASARTLLRQIQAAEFDALVKHILQSA